MTTTTDKIEKEVMLKAPVSRVWRALSDTREFGQWFGIDFKGDAFQAGKSIEGQLKCAGKDLTFDLQIDRIEPERVFSFRWHPYAVDTTTDYSSEPRTLVVFELKEVEGGTLLKVVESGFDSIPVARRAEAFKMNTGGWNKQLENIERYVTQPVQAAAV